MLILKKKQKTSWTFVSSSALRLVHEKLNQELDDVIVQTHHFSVLHALVQPQALRAPQKVLSGVVGVCFHWQGHGVELVAEEGEEVAVWDHGLRHEGPRDVLEVPETCRGKRKVWPTSSRKLYSFNMFNFNCPTKNKNIQQHNIPTSFMPVWLCWETIRVVALKTDAHAHSHSPWYMAWAPVQAKRLAIALALRKTSTWSDWPSRAMRSLWYRSGTKWNWVWP